MFSDESNKLETYKKYKSPRGPTYFKIFFILSLDLQQNLYIYIYIYIYIRGLLNKFADFIRMGTFIDSTHVKL